MKVEADEVVCKSFRLVDDAGHPLAGMAEERELETSTIQAGFWFRPRL